VRLGWLCDALEGYPRTNGHSGELLSDAGIRSLCQYTTCGSGGAKAISFGYNHGMDRKRTSWGHVADWYDSYMRLEGTYQKELILPNLLRLMELKKGEAVLDLACGQGFFAREFSAAGAEVTGVDLSKELIGIAKRLSPPYIRYHVGSADKLDFLQPGTFDKVSIVLAIQNIENAKGVFEEARRVLKPGGYLYLVTMHPAFRIPQGSSWDWDPKTGSQYRRVDRYLSESAVKIKMHPGSRPHEVTLTFHRPLQVYFKHLARAGFCVTRLEEWNSHKKSGPGPRAAEEDRARKEIPLFMFLQACAWK
jgi:ubiquinone/menaquinone biosynthesis C-methylase UbiE